MNFLLPVLYTAFFSWIILRRNFFIDTGIKPWVRLAVFYAKILTGVFVYYVYTHYYSNEKTADLLLYYSDGKIISQTLFTKPIDFFKIISGIGCDTDYFYENYFTKMDRWQRHHDSFFFNDCHTIIRFNAIVQLFSFGAVHVGTVIICFFSFSGLIALFRSFERFFREKRNLILLILFFSPALLFWGSSLLKEGLLLFALGFFVFAVFEWHSRGKIDRKVLLMLLIGLVVSLLNKIYVLMLIVPPLISLFLVHSLNLRFKSLIFFFVNVFSIAIGFLLFNFFFGRNFIKEIIRHQHDFINIAQGGVYLYRDSTAVRLAYSDQNRLIHTGKKDTVKIMTGSVYQTWNNNTQRDTLVVTKSTDTSTFWNAANIEPARSAYYMPHLNYSFSSFVLYTPQALFNVLLRPYIWEAENLYQKICSIENLFYIFFFLFCLFLGNYKNCNWSVFWFGLIFSLNLFLLIGFTTPVAGALVRYKVPAIPFLLLSATAILDVEKAKKIPVLKWFIRN